MLRGNITRRFLCDISFYCILGNTFFFFCAPCRLAGFCTKRFFSISCAAMIVVKFMHAF